jgi:acetyl esterase/lipase
MRRFMSIVGALKILKRSFLSLHVSYQIFFAGQVGWSGEFIIVTGDSAGGNLAAALTLMAIDKGIRIPGLPAC